MNKQPCKYNDCGWCYAPKTLITNCAANGSCVYPSKCPSINPSINLNK